MSKQRVVIIGSGLGGLSSGAILARNGYQVTVLEQGLQVGGCLQCFTRRGVRFETGMHYIGSADPGQNLDRMMRFLNIRDRIELSRLDTEGYNLITLDGEVFPYRNGDENFIEGMCRYFPDQKDNLRKYLDLVNSVAKASTMNSQETGDIALTTEYQMRSVNEVIDSVITDPKLSAVLSGIAPLYAGEKDKTPFLTHAFIHDFYNHSAFRIVGGSDSVAKALVSVIEEHGGEVRTRAKVTQILTDETRATGVEVNGEEFVGADIVISAIHPKRIIEMTGSKLLRPIYRRRIASQGQTLSGFSVYLHFKENTMPYMNTNYFGFLQDTPWGIEHYTDETWPKGYLYMHFCHEAKPKYARGGVVISYMTMDEVAKWSDTKVGRRGADYEEFKRIKAEKLIDTLNKSMPNFRDSIENYYTSTPLTYRDYTGTEDGSMYGIAKDVTAEISYRVGHRTKIPNLLLTGQNINSHGMLGVIVGSIVTCGDLLTPGEIYRQLNNAK